MEAHRTAQNRVLVTGAAGFIGAHLTRRLASRAQEVRAVDIRSRPPELDLPNISYHRTDIRDEDRIKEVLKDIDTVFHLASAHLEVHAAPEVYETTNVKAAENLVSLCAQAGVRRLIHTSSVGVYGHVESPPATEDSPTYPKTVYERTKLAGEEAALRAAAKTNLDVIVLRPAWVYGPGCPRTAKLLRSLQKKLFFYVGDGSNLRHPIFIDDLLDAFLTTAGSSPAVAGHTYIIAGPRPVPLREFVSTCAALSGLPEPKLSIPRAAAIALGWGAEMAFRVLRRDPPFSRRSLAFFENDSAFDISAAERDLGFTPKVELEDGLKRTIAALLPGGVWKISGHEPEGPGAQAEHVEPSP